MAVFERLLERSLLRPRELDRERLDLEWCRRREFELELRDLERRPRL